ncbi:MAG TPA: DUF1446 domain-containing protein [Phycicoccus sp.]|mgnify:CR=1 FL=1|jgi:hypothetical protein|nr:DUF1446 domain-containing protein [Phycicoccus sp.]HQK30570.1 DUF1446 domain-containing protein [Phycicoccus sp.]HQY97517.1 DUF1446 domain-containing protein [Phycicoccus sp.]
MRAARIGNSSGFYGDRLSAMRAMLDGGDLDYLTGDYLAELTMLILGRDLLKNPDGGYARTFLAQLEQSLGAALDRGVRIVANAGGLNPGGLAQAIRELNDRLGLTAKVAHVEGDNLLPRAAELGWGTPLTANAYLGGWGIAACLDAGPDIVVTGRVTDAALVVGAAAHHHGWKRTAYDEIAGAIAAGHVIECGTQATGGNFSFFTEIADLRRPGFPIAEVAADGSSVITKHPGTGGAVTTETVAAQLLYEVTGARYANPDATLRLDSITLSDDGSDRVRISAVRGEAPPPDLKVSLNRLGGYRGEVTFVLTGLDIEAKADLVKSQLAERFPADAQWTLARTDHSDSDTEEAASALLRCVAWSTDAKVVGRAMSGAAVEIALGTYPGAHLTAPPGDASPFGIYEAGWVPAGDVPHIAVLPDGSRVDIAPPVDTLPLSEVAEPAIPSYAVTGPTRRAPLGLVAGARSGDKGGSANIGVWARSNATWPWLVTTLTTERLRELLPETADLTIHRHVLPNLRAVNFVIEGILGAGVAQGVRFDPQAKALGEWLRSRHVDIPEEFLP